MSSSMEGLLWPPLVAFVIANILSATAVGSIRQVKQNLILQYQKGGTISPEEGLELVTQETSNKLDGDYIAGAPSFPRTVSLNSRAVTGGVSNVEYENQDIHNQTEQLSYTTEETQGITNAVSQPTPPPEEKPTNLTTNEIVEPVTQNREQPTDRPETPPALTTLSSTPVITTPPTRSTNIVTTTTEVSWTTVPVIITTSSTPTTTTSTTVTTTNPTTTRATTTTSPSTTITSTSVTPTHQPSWESRSPSQKPPTMEEASCSFGMFPEQSMCTWKNDRSGSLRWQVGTGKSANWLGGPAIDYNMANSSGGYAFVETSESAQREDPLSPGALLESAELGTTGSQGTCLIFGYSLDGLSAAELRVVLRSQGGASQRMVTGVRSGVDLQLLKEDVSGQDRVLWQSTYRARGWREARLLYTCHNPHKLVFEGLPVESGDPTRAYRGFISVDGVELKSGSSCQGYCTFAGGFCDWNNEPGDDFDWSLSRGSHNPVTGPSRDSASSGGYAFIDSSYPRRPGDVARLVSMTFPATGDDEPLCMRLWFHMFGPAVGTLRVLLRRFFHEASTPPTQEIWSLSGNAGNAWFMGEVTVSSLTEFQVVLEATVGNTAMGDIAVDDVSFTEGPCSAAPQVAAPLSGDCTFEVDECGWASSGNREGIEWKRMPVLSQEARHRRRSMAPTLSATGQNEYFLNLGRVLLQSAGSTTQFTSKVFQGSDVPRCITFWYFMYEPFIDVAGPSLGVLRVLLHTSGENSRPLLHPVWQLYNNQGPTWAFARAPIRESRPYRIIFEGIWGPNRATGSIAIDDIAFYDGDCTVEPPHANLRAEDCTFERGLCSWQNWTRTPPGERMMTWQKAFDTHRPAQLQDKTFGTSDGYIFFDIFATNQKQRQVRLLSPVVNPRKGNEILCFAFWFAAFGAGESTHLQLVSYPPRGDLDDVSGEPLWKLTAKGLDTARPTWTPAQVTLDNRRPLRLNLEGSASNGGFAVDDIRLLPGPCGIRPREAVAALIPG